MPKLHGSLGAAQPSRRPGDMQVWDPEKFFEDCRSRGLPAEDVARMRGLPEFCNQTADRTCCGHGKEIGSFTFHALKNGQTLSFFSVLSDGRLFLNFGSLREKLPVEILAMLRDGLFAIPSFTGFTVKEDFNNYPSIKIAKAFPTDESLDAFKELIRQLRDRIVEL